MRKRVVNLILVLAAVAVAAVLPPLLLRAEPANWSAIRAEVERMPPAERNRFDRNTEEYLRLPESERARYRQLHAMIEEDEQNGRGQLRETLDNYTAWLATNHAYDRQQLLAATDPEVRVDEIRSIVERRATDADRSRSRLSRAFMYWGWRRGDVPDLNAEELQHVMALVENGLSFNSEDLQKFHDENDNPKTGVVRYLALFGILKDRNNNLGTVLDRDLRKLLDAIPESKRPEDLDEMSPEEQRELCLRMIAGNVLQEFEQTFRKQAPSDQDLRRFVKEWPTDDDSLRELGRIMEREPVEFRRELERVYARKTFGMDVNEVFQVLPRDWWGRRFGRRRGSGERPDEGRDRERGPRPFLRGGPDDGRRIPERPGVIIPRGPRGGERSEAGPGRDRPRGPRSGEERPRPDGDRPPPPAGDRPPPG